MFSDSWLVAPSIKSSVNLEEFRDRVRGDVGLRGNNLLTDKDLNNWGNEASDLIGQELRWHRVVGSMDSAAGQPEYNLPSGVIAIEEVHYNQLPLRLLQLQDLATNYAYWRRNGDGTPLFYYLRGNSSFGLTPTPSTAISNGIFVVLTSLPPHPASDSDYFTIPSAGERALISYAKLKAAEKDAAGEGARRLPIYTKNWEDDLMALRKAVESVSEGEATVLGADVMPETGIWDRWLGFNPNNLASGPSS